jgi:hypothetical protein
MREKRGIFSSNVNPKSNLKKCVFSSRKAQAAMEYLMIAGIAFMIIVPMMYVLYQYTSDLNKDITDSKIGKIGTDISNTAEQIFYLGEPSRTTLRFDMPEGVYDLEVTGDKTLTFKLGDPIYSKEVSIFTNVNIISYLTPEDFTKGRKNLKIEAEKGQVVLYQGDKETALLKYAAYSVFKELMAGAAEVYSPTPLVTAGVEGYEISDNVPGEFAYISSSLANVDISADVNVKSIEGTVEFFIGKVSKTEVGTIESVTNKLSIEVNSAGNVITFTKLGEAFGSPTTFIPGETYNFKIIKSAYDDCSADLCLLDPAETPDTHYYLLIVSHEGTIQASQYIGADSVPINTLSDGFVFGDISETESFTDSTITNINPPLVVSTDFGRSASSPKHITTSVTFSHLDLQDNMVSFDINTGKVDADSKPIMLPISFRSYYPLADVLSLLESQAPADLCFIFTLEAGDIKITKGC